MRRFKVGELARVKNTSEAWVVSKVSSDGSILWGAPCPWDGCACVVSRAHRGTRERCGYGVIASFCELAPVENKDVAIDG